MKANPGGQIAPSEVVGRDGLIERLWDVLDRQSVVLTAERRIGKTSVVKKMQAEAPKGVFPVYHDLEGMRSVLEFTERMFGEVSSHLRARSRVAKRTRAFLENLSGAEFSGIKLPEASAEHWKKLLRKIAEDLAEHQGQTPLFFWDEMPLMLLNIREQQGAPVAMELLDMLRELRQTHDALRMVFTGSIGMDHVITSLKAKGYANAPLNDMKALDVPPLDPPDARELASMLLEGEQVESEDAQAVARTVAASVDHVPYYIHYVVDELKYRSAPVSESTVETVVTEALTDPQDGWHMRHYRERIDLYYPESQRPLVLTLLDTLADEEPLSFVALFDRLKARREVSDEEAEHVRDVLTLLQRDHYVEIDPEDGYRFRFPLIRRWWRMNRL